MILFYSLLDSEPKRNKFDAIRIKYAGLMYSVAYDIMQDSQLAEDAVSEAYIKIIKNIDNIFDISGNKTRSYIVIIVRSVCFDLLRKEKRQTGEYFGEIDDFESCDTPALENMVISEACDLIAAHIKSLPKHYADTLYLHLVCEMPYERIAELLGISEATARTRVSRGKAKLRELLTKEGITNE